MLVDESDYDALRSALADSPPAKPAVMQPISSLDAANESVVERVERAERNTPRTYNYTIG